MRLFDLVGENKVADYMIYDMYLEPPYSHETQEQQDLRCRCRVMATFISVTMRLGMEDGIWPMVGSLKPRVVMAHLRSHFVEQVCMWEYELMGDFLSIKMEEGSSLDDHLLSIYDAYMSLAYYMDNWFSSSFALGVVLRSLPPSFQAQVRICIMRGETETLDFLEFISHFRGVVVEPGVAGVIDDKGIYFLYSFINVIILQTHLQ